jgi:hypothetical protein
MSEENKNPFTIGKPFTIEFDDEPSNSITEEDVKEEAETPTEDKADQVVEEQVREEETPEPSEEGKIKIEDILDKPVQLDDTPSEVAKKDEQAKEAVTEALSSTDLDFDFKEVTDRLVKAGFWEDFEGRDELEVDKETFEELSKQQDAWKRESLATTLYSSLDPAEKEYLAFKKNGGDLNSYYESKRVVDRIGQIDLDSDQGKLNSIYTYYKNFVGWSDEKINKHLGRIAKDTDDLEEEAQTAYNFIQDHAKREHEQLLNNQKKAAEEREQAVKSYKKNLRAILKEQKMNNNQIRTVVDGLTKVDETGFAEIDKAFLQFRNNPEYSVLLYRFLTDFDAFVDEVSSKKEQETKKKVFMELKKSKKVQEEKKDFSFRPTRDRQTKNPFLK